MKSIDVLQGCYDCGDEFVVRYYENGSTEYITEPCQCECAYAPINGPTITQWLESIKE